jgi:uncharacterized protein
MLKKTLLLAGVAALVTACNTEVRVADVSFATSGQGGTFYVAGAGIAALTTQEIEGLTVTAEVTLGVVENARLMKNNETEMGFLYGSTAYNIQRGIGEFVEDGAYPGIRGVANIHDGALNFVTLQRNTSIRTLDDLVGKKVSIGPRGSGSASVAEEFLRSVNLFDSINIQYLSFNDSTTSLRDNNLDALVIGGTAPVPALIELDATNPMFVIPVEQSRINQFLTAHPYHVEYTIPTGIYTSVTQPVKTVGYSVIWGARDDVPAWVIQSMLEVIFADSGKEYLISVQGAFRELSPGIDRFERINLPLHAGATAYYRAQGLLA